MSTSVNVPTNPKQRDADVENKLRLYGIYEAFSNGKLPTNEQIDVALTSFIKRDRFQKPNSKLSDDGKSLLEDFRAVVEEAKRLFITKNHDEALQNFIYHATLLGHKGGPDATKPNAPIDKNTAKTDGQRGVDGLRTLGQLVISNGQFRKLLSDVTVLLRDIAGDAATKSASKISPPRDRLAQIDDPAPDQQWHDTPTFDKDQLKSQFRETFDNKAPVNTRDVQDVIGNATQQAHTGDSRDPRDVGRQVADEQQHGHRDGVDAQAGLQKGINDLRERADDDKIEEKKKKGREYRDRTKGYLQTKMPQARRDQTIWRLKKMIVEIQSQEDYSQAIDALLGLAETYKGHGKSVADQAHGAFKGAHGDNHIKSAESQLKTLLERFANYTSADDLIEALNNVYHDADKDPELKNWFRSINSFVRRCLKEDGYILQDSCHREYDQLYDHGNFLLRDRYRENTDRLLDEVKFFGDQFTHDDENNRFANSLQKLFDNLGTDSSGKVAFKKHLLKDVSQVILPDVFESVRYVPIPRIEYSDKMVDAVIENLIVESDNLMPNVFEIGSDSYFRWGRHKVSNKKSQEIMVAASGIQCDLKDVAYYIRKKQGFPSLTDQGIADFILSGEGVGFKLELASNDKKDSFFKVNTCKVSVKGLSIRLKQSNHKALFGIFKPLLIKMVKPVLVKVLEQQIRHAFERFDAMAFRVYQEQQKIEANIRNNPDPENITNIYQRYYQAFQTEMVTHKKKLEAKTADKKVNVAVTANDSMFKDIKLPGGFSAKATHYKEMATSGEGWKSEVFSIGSAKASTIGSINPTNVTRKSPVASRRQVKERRDSGFQAQQTGTELPAGNQVGGEGRGEFDPYRMPQNGLANEKARQTYPNGDTGITLNQGY